jgi:hypothetical protein
MHRLQAATAEFSTDNVFKNPTPITDTTMVQERTFEN